MTDTTRALTAAEHLVGNLYFNLEYVPVLAGRIEPDTMRFAVGGESGMVYSEMCRLLRSPGERLSAGSLEAGLRAQGFNFEWIAKLQSRIELESLETLHNYAGEVNNAADLKRIRMYCHEADKAAADVNARADTVAAGLLSKLSEANKSASNVESAGAVMQRVRERLEQIRAGNLQWGASTGFASLDKIFQMVDGDLITIAGRPSQGKSSLWRQIFYNRAKQIVVDGEKAQVVMFSSDDTPEKLMMGLACTVARVDSKNIRRNQATAEEWTAVERAMADIESLPITIDGTPNPTVEAMYYRCAMLNAQKRVVLAGQDYLGLIDVPNAKSELQEAQRSAGGCKGIGQTLGFPFLLLSQLGKAVEGRADKWPTPSDLMFSGEAESDTCMLILRPEHYILRGEDVECTEQDKSGVVLINVGKNKSGEIGMVRMQFTKELSRFEDLAHGF